MLDVESEDLRVIELVKMGDKSKELDRRLGGGHRSAAGKGLCAAEWLGKASIATARGGEFCV